MPWRCWGRFSTRLSPRTSTPAWRGWTCHTERGRPWRWRKRSSARLYAEALRLAEEIGNTANMAYCLRGLAECSGARGEAEKAARLYGATAAFLEGVGLRFDALVTGRDFHERYLSLARARMEDRAWAAAWSQGRGMGFDEAVAHALGGDAAQSVP